ncbi:MAG: inner membrane-spanning protein YciB [Gammaproteobacteria bacterium]
MKAAGGIFPAAVFFAVYFGGDIFPAAAADYFGGKFYLATAALMAAICLQLAAMKILHKPVEKELWLVAAMVLLFGGASLLLRDEFWLMIKTTVVYWLFAAAFLIAEMKFGKNPLRALLGSTFSAPDNAWRRLTFALAGFFGLLGTVNLMVLHLVSTDQWSPDRWVLIKTFGYPAATFCFLIAAFVWLHKAGDNQ